MYNTNGVSLYVSVGIAGLKSKMHSKMIEGFYFKLREEGGPIKTHAGNGGERS